MSDSNNTTYNYYEVPAGGGGGIGDVGGEGNGNMTPHQNSASPYRPSVSSTSSSSASQPPLSSSLSVASSASSSQPSSGSSQPLQLFTVRPRLLSSNSRTTSASSSITGKTSTSSTFNDGGNGMGFHILHPFVIRKMLGSIEDLSMGLIESLSLLRHLLFNPPIATIQTSSSSSGSTHLLQQSLQSSSAGSSTTLFPSMEVTDSGDGSLLFSITEDTSASLQEASTITSVSLTNALSFLLAVAVILHSQSLTETVNETQWFFDAVVRKELQEYIRKVMHDYLHHYEDPTSVASKLEDVDQACLRMWAAIIEHLEQSLEISSSIIATAAVPSDARAISTMARTLCNFIASKISIVTSPTTDFYISVTSDILFFCDKFFKGFDRMIAAVPISARGDAGQYCGADLFEYAGSEAVSCALQLSVVIASTDAKSKLNSRRMDANAKSRAAALRDWTDSLTTLSNIVEDTAAAVLQVMQANPRLEPAPPYQVLNTVFGSVASSSFSSMKPSKFFATPPVVHSDTSQMIMDQQQHQPSLHNTNSMISETTSRPSILASTDRYSIATQLTEPVPPTQTLVTTRDLQVALRRMAAAVAAMAPSSNPTGSLISPLTPSPAASSSSSAAPTPSSSAAFKFRPMLRVRVRNLARCLSQLAESSEATSTTPTTPSLLTPSIGGLSTFSTTEKVEILKSSVALLLDAVKTCSREALDRTQEGLVRRDTVKSQRKGSLEDAFSAVWTAVGQLIAFIRDSEAGAVSAGGAGMAGVARVKGFEVVAACVTVCEQVEWVMEILNEMLEEAEQSAAAAAAEASQQSQRLQQQQSDESEEFNKAFGGMSVRRPSDNLNLVETLSASVGGAVPLPNVSPSPRSDAMFEIALDMATTDKLYAKQLQQPHKPVLASDSLLIRSATLRGLLQRLSSDEIQDPMAVHVAVQALANVIPFSEILAGIKEQVHVVCSLTVDVSAGLDFMTLSRRLTSLIRLVRLWVLAFSASSATRKEIKHLHMEIVGCVHRIVSHVNSLDSGSVAGASGAYQNAPLKVVGAVAVCERLGSHILKMINSVLQSRPTPPPRTAVMPAKFNPNQRSNSFGTTPPTTSNSTNSAPIFNLPMTLTPKSLIQVDAIVIAQHMLTIDRAIYLAITPFEFLSSAFSPPKSAADASESSETSNNHTNKSAMVGAGYEGGKNSAMSPIEIRNRKRMMNAPNVVALNERFNFVVGIVSTAVMSCETPKARAGVIMHWIRVAYNCLQLRNLNGANAIVSSLQSASIHRLTKTWEQIPKNVLDLFQNLKSLFSASGNFRALRELMASINLSTSAGQQQQQPSQKQQVPPMGYQMCVPWLGMYLRELIQVSEAYPAMIDATIPSEGGGQQVTPDAPQQQQTRKHINFLRCRWLNATIDAALRFQRPPFSPLHDPSSSLAGKSGYIAGWSPWGDEEVADLSFWVSSAPAPTPQGGAAGNDPSTTPPGAWPFVEKYEWKTDPGLTLVLQTQTGEKGLLRTPSQQFRASLAVEPKKEGGDAGDGEDDDAGKESSGGGGSGTGIATSSGMMALVGRLNLRKKSAQNLAAMATAGNSSSPLATSSTAPVSSTTTPTTSNSASTLSSSTFMNNTSGGGNNGSGGLSGGVGKWRR